MDESRINVLNNFRIVHAAPVAERGISHSIEKKEGSEEDDRYIRTRDASPRKQ